MDTKQTKSTFRDSTLSIISTVAYLIGVPKSIFENEHEPPQLETYVELEKQTKAKILRELCRLRSSIERNYGNISASMKRDFRTLMTMPEYIPVDAITFLSNEGISLIKKNNKELVDYVMDLNRLICDRVNNCKDLFPIWLNWEYIKDLFIMPNGLNKEGTKRAADTFYDHKQWYPYQIYINWTPVDCGNVLYSDRKFVTTLYEQHHDEFRELSMVLDADEDVKNSIYDFIGESGKTVLVVDCENSDPFRLIAMLTNLDRDLVGRITKVILYNDVHASTGWNLFESYAQNLEVEHIMTERVKENKSLVDIKLSMGVSKEYYKNDVDSFIIASSDSDYWALIESIPEARFFVLFEHEKCGPDIKEALIRRGIPFCYIDEFCTGNANEIKLATLVNETKRYIEKHMDLNVQVMLDEVYRTTRVQMSEAEYRQFYNTYIKPMHLVIQENGDVTIELRGR